MLNGQGIRFTRKFLPDQLEVAIGENLIADIGSISNEGISLLKELFKYQKVR